ncbi:MAG: diacylglycerol kinase family lipid kinase [Spirochaetes bacterium]|nr:diacylglycerol kinase family lipid kinase [Spirochaetota bacterium]
MKLLDLFIKKRSSKFRSAYVIINPAAGKMQINKFLNLSKSYFKKYKIKYEYSLTASQGDASRLAHKAVQDKYDIVFAAGGDGTVNEVANGIMSSSKTVLGIIPLGTVNILSLELNIPQNPLKALDLIFEGRVNNIDIGKANDKYFVLMAGCGFDSYAIYRVNLKLKKYLGAIAYIFAGLYSAIKYKPKKININIDNHRIDDVGYFVVAENAGSYGGMFKLAPYADFNDGLLDVCVFKKYGFFEVIRYFWGIALGQHMDFPDVRYYQCRNVELFSDENVLLHTDGELIGSLPVSVTVNKERLKILVP